MSEKMYFTRFASLYCQVGLVTHMGDLVIRSLFEIPLDNPGLGLVKNLYWVCSLHLYPVCSLHFVPGLQSAFCTWSAVCNLYPVCSLHFVPGLQSTFCTQFAICSLS